MIKEESFKRKEEYTHGCKGINRINNNRFIQGIQGDEVKLFKIQNSGFRWNYFEDKEGICLYLKRIIISIINDLSKGNRMAMGEVDNNYHYMFGASKKYRT